MGRSRSTTQRVRTLGIVATIFALLGSGCVERRLIIRTNPPGALAYVDDNEVGLTPVAISPIYYGSRKIRLVKDGCETLTLIQTVPAPWYEIPPLDFFSENLVPGRIRDVRTFDYQLRPQGVVPKEELLTRAEALRRGTQTMTGVATPGYRVGPASPGQVFVPPVPGTAVGPAIGGQPSYQLPPANMENPAPISPGPAIPTGPITRRRLGPRRHRRRPEAPSTSRRPPCRRLPPPGHRTSVRNLPIPCPKAGRKIGRGLFRIFVPRKRDHPFPTRDRLCPQGIGFDIPERRLRAAYAGPFRVPGPKLAVHVKSKSENYPRRVCRR